MSLSTTVTYSKHDIERLAPHLANWLTAQAYIARLEESEASLFELQKMISIELYRADHPPRVQMITRLRGRFVAMRKAMEDRIIFRMLKDGGK